MNWKIQQGDCRERMAKLKSGVAHLCCADPPYNQGEEYDAYEDNKSYDEYMEFTRTWLKEAHRILHAHGALWVFAPDEWADEISMFCRHELKMTRRRWVIWAFTFGQAARKNFTRSHCHVFYFTKTKTRFTWNEDNLRVPSARQLVYGDKRANPKGKLPDDTWMLLEGQMSPHMTPDRDTWMTARICGTFHERRPHSPNQIPLPLMERIITTTSNPGDLVVDPFVGTGSSGVVAVTTGRSFRGYDLSAECVEQSRQRIEDALKKVG